MSTEQISSQRREYLAELVVGLGEEEALIWLESNLWLEAEDEYGGADLPTLVADELDILSDEQVEQCIAELES
jgi:hypothetical protein